MFANIKNVLNNKKILVIASYVFGLLGVGICLLGLKQESEIIGATGMGMFIPAIFGFFRVLSLCDPLPPSTCRKGVRA